MIEEKSGRLGVGGYSRRAKIRDIAYHLPDFIETNEVLRHEYPEWDMNVVEKGSGVLKRHIAADDETALDLAYEACLKLFQNNPEASKQIDGIICCTQTPDYIMPPNACILQERLGLSEDIFALDFNLACSGYVYGLAMVQGLIGSGIRKNVLLVTADTYSKIINKQDRATRVLFGDGAAVTWLSESDSQEGIIDIECATSGKYNERLYVPAGGFRMPKSSQTAVPETDKSGNIRTPEDLYLDGIGIMMFVKSKIPKQIYSLLEKNSIGIEEIDYFAFHQASQMVLDSLGTLMKIGSAKLLCNIRDVGNTVSASIPILLADAKDSGSLSKGSLVILSGFGGGLSWGSALYRF